MPKGGYSCAITHRKRMCKVDFSRWVPINFCVMMGVHALHWSAIGVLYHEAKRFSRWFDPTKKDSWESSFFYTIGIKLSWQFSWQAKSSLILAWSFGKRNVPIKVGKTLPHRAAFKKEGGSSHMMTKNWILRVALVVFDAVWKDICDIKEFDVKTFNAKLFEFSLSKCWLTKRRQSQTQNWLLMVVEKEWW